MRVLAKLCGGGRAATRRRIIAILVVAAGAFGATGDNRGALAKLGGDAENAALEEAFFETLWRCESPLLIERNEAEDALFERFAEFEPIWQDRRFLTNGEIGAEARRRFELAEARYRDEAFDDCAAAFKATFETVETEAEGERNRGDEGNNVEKNEKNGEDGETLRGFVRLRWEKPLRIVYLSPDWSAFERRDGDGTRRRPSGRFSAPELAPVFDASELTFETTWERVDGEETAGDGENRGSAENGEGKATVVGALEGLIGGDFRVWTLPLGAVASRNAKTASSGESAKDGKDERGDQAEEKRETAAVGVDFPTVFQSGDAVATVGETTINAKGETTAQVRFDFAEAFDAFDSHRVWCDQRDFALIIDAADEKLEVGADIDALEAENEARKREKEEEITGENDATGINGAETVEEGAKPKFVGITAVTGITGAVGEAETTGLTGTTETGEGAGAIETDAAERRWAPIRLRVRERSANGALFELDFPDDAALREAVAQGRARLACRIPRFFFWTRIEIGGTEKTTDDGGERGDARTATNGAERGDGEPADGAVEGENE